MRALVTGGCGFVGRYLVRALLEQGHTCRLLVRASSDTQWTNGLSGIELFEGDITRPQTLEGIADDIDVVFHLAAEGHVSAVSKESLERFVNVNVGGTENLLAACKGKSIRKFVHFSSTAAMGLIKKPLVDESDPPQPVTLYQKSKLQSEKAALEKGKAFGIAVVVVRPCMIYGVGGKGEFHKMCRLMKKGFFPKVGFGRNLTPLVHVSDVVQGAIKAAENGKSGEVYLLTSAKSISMDQMRQYVMDAWGERAIYPYVPVWLMVAAAWAFEILGRLTGKAPLATRRNIASTVWDREFSIEKAKHDLGYQPKVDFKDGIRQTVEWFKFGKVQPQQAKVFSRKVEDQQKLESVLEELFNAVGGFAGRFLSGDTVLIKPNFVAPFEHATTDLRMIDFFVQKIRELGGEPVIGETSGYEFGTEGTFDILGIRAYCADNHVKLINFEQDEYVTVDIGADFKPVEIAKSALDAKLIVNLPVLKGHTITRVTGATKNLFGFLSKPSRRYLHFHRLEEGIVALGKHFDHIVHFVDARYLLSRAVFGEPKMLGYFLAGDDCFAIDHFGSPLLGIDPDAVRYLHWTGKYEIDGISAEAPGPLQRRDSFKERLHRKIYSAFYRIDHIKSAIFGGASIIPQLHWYLGVHPEIGNVSEADLKKLADICPLGAIDVKGRRIVKQKCIHARCLRCYCHGAKGQVKLKGFGKPKEND